jgi:hypothetical protein
MRAISGRGLDILGLSNDLKENEDVSILGIQSKRDRTAAFRDAIGVG